MTASVSTLGIFRSHKKVRPRVLGMDFSLIPPKNKTSKVQEACGDAKPLDLRPSLKPWPHTHPPTAYVDSSQ